MRKYIGLISGYYLILSYIFITVTKTKYSLLLFINTICFITLIAIIEIILKKRYRIVFHIVSSTLYFIFYLVQLLNYIIKRSFVELSDFTKIEEAFDVRDIVFDNISPMIIFIIVLYIINIFIVFKIDFEELKIKKISIAILAFSLLISNVMMYQKDKMLYTTVFDNNGYILNFGMENFFLRAMFPFLKNDIEVNDLEMLSEIENFEFVDNEYLGLFKEKDNVVFIIAESFHELAIDNEVTPNLYKLRENGMYFSNYYTITIGTDMSEYATLTSLLPPPGNKFGSYANGMNSIPEIFEANGYCTLGVHSNESSYYNRESVYSNVYKFQEAAFSEELELDEYSVANPRPDDMMWNSSTKFIDEDCDKTFSYYMTMSGHGPYDESREDIKANIKDIDSKHDYRSYLAAHINLDKMIYEIENYYEQRGELDELLIIMVSDHQPYTIMSTDTAESFTDKYKEQGRVSEYNVPFLIYDPTSDFEENDKYSSNVDILPTISHLFGFSYKYTMGNNVLDDSYDGKVYWYNNMGYTILTDSYLYSMDSTDIDAEYAKEVEELIVEQKMFIAEYMQLYKK